MKLPALILLLLSSAPLALLEGATVANTTAPKTTTDDGGNVIVIDPGILDKDNDGMEDAWELANGLNPKDPKDALADPDHDGLTNLQEFQFGSDPNSEDTDKGGVDDFSEWVLNKTLQTVSDAIFGKIGSIGGGVLPILPGDPTTIIPDLTGAGSNASSSSGKTITTKPPVTIPPVIGGIPVTDAVIAKAKLLLFDLLDILPLVSPDGYDPADGSDDASAKEVITKLKAAELWHPMVGLATGKLKLNDVVALLFGTTTPNLANLGKGTTTSGSSTNTTAADNNAAKTATTTAKSTAAGNSSLTGSVATSKGGSKAGNNGANTNAGSSGGASNKVGGGSGKSSSGGGSSRSGYVSSVRVTSKTSTSNGVASTASTHTKDSGDHDKHDHGGSDSGHHVRTGKKISTAENLVAAKGAAPSNTSGSWWFMGLVPALGFAARRLIGFIG